MDQNPLHKAAALVEAYGYIRAFAGKTVVVKIGGSIMDEPDNLMSLVEDVCFMAAVGMRPVLVHGGGKAINAVPVRERACFAAKKGGGKWPFFAGREHRYDIISLHLALRSNLHPCPRVREHCWVYAYRYIT